MKMLLADDHLLFRVGLRNKLIADALCVAVQSGPSGESHG